VRRYLDAPEVKIDNHLIENALRSFFLGKKNSLFAQTEDGGDASVALNSLIMPAKANGLHLQGIYKRVIEQLPACCELADYEALQPYSQVRG
jgi:transposase